MKYQNLDNPAPMSHVPKNWNVPFKILACRSKDKSNRWWSGRIYGDAHLKKYLKTVGNAGVEFMFVVNVKLKV